MSIQRELFIPASELAVLAEHYLQYCGRGKVVTEEMAERFTRLIEEYEGRIELPREFVIPGGTMSSAVINLVQTMVRRAERIAVQLKDDGLLPNENILKYLNRLADLLFILARYEEQQPSRLCLERSKNLVCPIATTANTPASSRRRHKRRYALRIMASKLQRERSQEFVYLI